MLPETPQPFDVLMNQLGLTNAQLVNASTEQLSFKMVQKGRKGRRITPNVQDKILNALLKLKPDLKVRRRDMFRYDLNESSLAALQEALALIQKNKIKYPQYIDRLNEAGINRYAVEVASHRTTFYGPGGEAHVMQSGQTNSHAPGSYNEAALRAAITDAQKAAIDYPTFLKKIYEAGIGVYEVNIYDRKIVYKSNEHSYRENIPSSDAVPEAADAQKEAKPIEKKIAKTKAGEKPKKKKKPGVVRKTRKARLKTRKLFFQKKKNKRKRA